MPVIKFLMKTLIHVIEIYLQGKVEIFKNIKQSSHVNLMTL